MGYTPTFYIKTVWSTPSLEQFENKANWYTPCIINTGQGSFGHTGTSGKHGDSRY